MIYVVLDSGDLQLRRIRNRVADGGHDVPADKVASRRIRSFEQLAWFINRVDECLIFDNSTGQPALVAALAPRGQMTVFEKLPPDLERALRADAPALFPDRQ
ncbi:MAG: hypothetical protein V4564_19670 [Pseudomonadota bacterium]